MCNACVAVPDIDTPFVERMVGMLDQAATVQMISLGHRTGLFDAMAGAGPLGAAGIAERAGLVERYVREWLGCMAASRIVVFDAPNSTYELPEQHAAFLTRAASPNNLAATTQFMPVLAGAEDEVLECFRSGGGVPYSSYPRFHEVMAEESDMTVVAGLTDHILPLVPGLVGRLRDGIDVLDVGCGRGRAMLAMAAEFPHSRFTGMDLSAEAVRAATEEAAVRGLTNVSFETRDLTGFSDQRRWDFVTAFDAVHDQSDPAGLISGVRSCLAQDGLFLVQDIAGSSDVGENIGRPLAPFIYTISCMHCMTVSLAQGGTGLGAAWGEQLAEQMFREGGFTEVETFHLEHDILNAFYVCRV